jgi:hypothetical protein
MTETTAKSGGSKPPATPVDEEPAESGTAAAGRSAVGRAVVNADAPSPPKFTRAPGMTPPPDEPPADGKSEGAGAGSLLGGTAPIVSKAKKAVAAAAEVAANAVKKEPATGTRPEAAARAAAGPAARPAATPTRPGVARPTGPAGPTGPAAPAAAGSAAVGAARVTEAVRAARSAVSSAAARGPRRARLNLKRIDPWSVMKFAFAVSVVLFIVVVVATSVLYLSLDAMEVWSKVNATLAELLQSGGAAGGSQPFHITAWGVIGTSMLIGAVNVVLFTALATLSAFIYNVCADLVGGIELTLAERD